MVIRAVVFDYYGTLAVSATRAARRSGAERIAAALGIPADVWHAAIAATFTERATGVRGDLEQTMHWLAEQCGRTPQSDQLKTACEIRRSTEGVYARTLRDDAEETLRTLHERGIKLGVLSDCTHELPDVWPTLSIAPYVDVTVFSVQAGLRKPHPDLYASVALSLGVAPSECLYVGDGGSGELTGAAQAGMTPYHLVTPDAVDATIYDPDSAWTGSTIQSLSDVLGLV